jgi:hypothetical protein
MKMKILAILILSASLACADLSPEDFNQLRSTVIKHGAYFAGVSRIGNSYLYRFNNQKNEPIAFVPMEVGDFIQAHAAFLASMGTMILCKQQWKIPLEDLRSHIVGPPPEGYTFADESQIVGILMK